MSISTASTPAPTDRTVVTSGTTQTWPEAGIAYRPDIDGLRAFAVLSVLLFHLGVPGISGGFVGVDIFFVISGFLITSILIRDLDAGRFSLAHFYRRRALRILPPIFVVLLSTLVIGALVLLPHEISSLGNSAVATLLFISNIFFWQSIDYFTADAKQNPLLHTWSLGVEEQFYIVVPLLLWLTHHYARRHLPWIFAATVAISFALSLVTIGPMPRATFYLLPTRYWELGIGALLVFFGPGDRLRPGFRLPLSLIGGVLIGYGIFRLNSGSAFPAGNALWPCLGTACLIAAGANSPGGRILAHPLPVWIGQISYSLYLWHWPLIVLFKLRFGSDISPLQILFLGVLSFLLAALSTRFLERPFRAWRGTNASVLIAAAATITVFSLLFATLARHPDTLRDYPEGVLALDVYSDYFSQPEFRAAWQYNRCHLDPDTPGGFAGFDRTECLTERGSRTALVMGDSHAAHIWKALADARPDLSVLQATSTNCRPLALNFPQDFCGELARFLYLDWIPRHRPDTVVLSGLWRRDEEPALAESIRYLKTAGVRQVILLGVSVKYSDDLPDLLARGILYRRKLTDPLPDPSIWRSNDRLAGIAARAGAVYVDLLEVICPGKACRSQIDGTPLLFDSNHYTAEAAAFIARSIAGRL